jgi:hypothetical protein
VIISLASSHTRLDAELPITVHSLTRQTVRPKEIRIYFPQSEKGDVQKRIRPLLDTYEGMAPPVGEDRPLSEHLFHPLVRFMFVEDIGPATKYVPIIRELLFRVDGGELEALDQPVIVLGELDRARV